MKERLIKIIRNHHNIIIHLLNTTDLSELQNKKIVLMGIILRHSDKIIPPREAFDTQFIVSIMSNIDKWVNSHVKSSEKDPFLTRVSLWTIYQICNKLKYLYDSKYSNSSISREVIEFNKTFDFNEIVENILYADIFSYYRKIIENFVASKGSTDIVIKVLHTVHLLFSLIKCANDDVKMNKKKQRILEKRKENPMDGNVNEEEMEEEKDNNIFNYDYEENWFENMKYELCFDTYLYILHCLVIDNFQDKIVTEMIYKTFKHYDEDFKKVGFYRIQTLNLFHQILLRKKSFLQREDGFVVELLNFIDEIVQQFVKDLRDEEYLIINALFYSYTGLHEFTIPKRKREKIQPQIRKSQAIIRNENNDEEMNDWQMKMEEENIDDEEMKEKKRKLVFQNDEDDLNFDDIEVNDHQEGNNMIINNNQERDIEEEDDDIFNIFDNEKEEDDELEQLEQNEMKSLKRSSELLDLDDFHQEKKSLK